MAVRLTPGQYVEFTLPKAAKAVTVRYSIPDAPAGGGMTAPLDVAVNGRKRAVMTLTSQYAWLYNQYPFSTDPNGQGRLGRRQPRLLSGVAIEGDIRERIDTDQVTGVGGAMSDSTIDGLYQHHHLRRPPAGRLPAPAVPLVTALRRVGTTAVHVALGTPGPIRPWTPACGMTFRTHADV
ncbi:hypothetical protein [Microbispora sp. H10885]|uniref:hypothetical protein n=1 Tax=Microbispora sp. H10885 TaxID=2729110 RepID=UPI001C7292C4|nr:hypothetical protein [Microbispora sp. H10885]